MRNCIFLAFLLFLISVTGLAQSTPLVTVVHDRHVVKSMALGAERDVLVRVPRSYERGNARYPVVYMLDGSEPHTTMMPGILDNQAWGGQIPEMILVSIPNKARTIDLTPTVIERYPSGGGGKFLDFIQKEVMPLVEKNYRTQPYKIFAGHSLAGMFVVYSFIARPEMFNAYIAASPSLYYDQNLPIKSAEAVFKQDKDWNKIMYLGLGDEPLYIDSFNGFKKLVERVKPKNFSFGFREYKDENHSSVVLPVYKDGLRKIFEGWVYPQEPSIAVQEAHFKKLSKKYGYEIKIPENLLNIMGYEFLQAKKYAEAIESFQKNVELYPDSANAYDSLAEAFEKNGDLKNARDNYEKAYKLAESQGLKELAKSAKENFDRLEKREN